MPETRIRGWLPGEPRGSRLELVPPADLDRQAQRAWEDEELLPIMSDDARRWWIARRAENAGKVAQGGPAKKRGT